MSIEGLNQDGAISLTARPATGKPVQHRTFDPVGGRLKRSFDIAFSSLALVSFSLLMAVIALILKVFTKGPVLFVHPRIGANGQVFPCLKFRTMVEDADLRLEALLQRDPAARAEFEATQKLRNDPRIVPVIGRFLRQTSLDELPQFFNVLAGQMSVVGPRPVTHNEWVTRYGIDHPYRRARPGITGLWQTSGRNDISFEERIRMDSQYVKTWSFYKDIKIILRTVYVMCRDRNGH